jgi:hypothetical protein
MVGWRGLLLILAGQTGLLVWLGKKLITQLFEKDADKNRASLKLEGDTQIERLKNSLQMLAYERQVRFSKLHERRADKIADLYKLLNEVPAVAAGFILMEPKNYERQKIAENKILELYRFIEENRIYFPVHVCDLLDKFSNKLRKSVIFVGVYWGVPYPTEKTTQDQRQVMFDAVTALETEIPKLKTELTVEFRKLLGEVH